MFNNENDSGNAAEHAPPNDEPVHLNIQVRDNNNEIFFAAKPHTKFEEIFNAFCARSGQEKSTCRFFFDGQRLLDDTTPTDMDMEDKNIIEVYQEQQGGSAGDENASPAASGEEPKAEPVHMNIKVVENQNEVFFKVKPHTKFKKIFDAYCSRTGKSRDSVRFLFEGERLLDENTPQDRDIEDGDQIDVMQEQTGGASARNEASPSPPPRAPIALTPGPRATAFKALYDSTLSHTLRAITYDNFAACFPMIAENAPEQLKSIHKDLTERLDRFAKNEFETIIQERHVIANLNSLEDLIADAKRRKSRSTSTEDDAPPTPPHLLPAPAIASAHLSSLFASQQSQLNAKLQTVQSQNATLATTIAEQKSEIERLVAQLEAVVGDLDKANGFLEDKVGDLADDARKAEMEMSAA